MSPEPTDEERRRMIQAIDAKAPHDDEEDDEDPEEAETAEYVEALGEELRLLYGSASGLGRDNFKVATGTVVSQLLEMQTRDAILDVGEKLEELSTTILEVRDLLASQDERAAAVAAQLASEAPKP